jgi:hypothetical protein
MSDVAMGQGLARTWTKIALATLGALVVGLLGAEVSARLLGYSPAVDTRATSPWTAFDTELGWTNNPGARLSSGIGFATIEADGSRRTKPHPIAEPRGVVLVLGCSYTLGFGVDDKDAFAWKLQERFPEFDVKNFGTAGYGTYQSLLRFRRFQREGHPAPVLVVFGFADFHGARDRATRSFMGNTRAYVAPHVDLSNRRLVEKPGRFTPMSAPARVFALWNLAEWTYKREVEYAPDDEKTIEIHRATLLQLRREIEAAGSRLLVANLWTTPLDRPSWHEFFRLQGFHVAECVSDRLPYAHPDLFWNLRHADCVEEALRRERLLDD